MSEDKTPAVATTTLRCRCGNSGPSGTYHGSVMVKSIDWAIVVWDHDEVPSWIKFTALTFDAEPL